MNNFTDIVDLLIEGETDKATEYILMENIEQQMLRSVGGDRMPLNYILKFEEYLDDHDIYLFDGWEDAVLVSAPEIDKFWVTIYLFCPEKVDLRGALRITNDKEGQNQIKVKKCEGGNILQFKVLKRYLDQIEERNIDKAEQLADEEMEQFNNN
jgi:hypothetical protein